VHVWVAHRGRSLPYISQRRTFKPMEL